MLQTILILATLLLSSASLYFAVRDISDLASGLKWISAFLISAIFLSIAFDVSLVANIPFMVFVSGSFVLSLLVISILAYRNKYLFRILADDYRTPKLSRIFRIMLFFMCGTMSILFVGESHRWGGWDAWAIWNLHARFLTSGAAWRQMFTQRLSWSHPDYPLLLPSLVAIFWKAAGYCSPVIPSAIAWITTMFIPVVVCLGLKNFNNWFIPIASFLFFIFNRDFYYQGASQYADTILSLLLLLAFIFINQTSRDWRLFFLAGFFMGFTGWVKNEGLMLYAVFTIGVMLTNFKTLSNFLKYLSGSIIPLFIIYYFKSHYAPASDLLTGQDTHMLMEKFRDFSRYQTIWDNFHEVVTGNFLFSFVIFILTALASRRVFENKNMLILFSFLLCYFFTYIFTPNQLKWHLESSSIRLFHQLYPAFVFSLLLFVKGRSAEKTTSGKQGNAFFYGFNNLEENKWIMPGK